MAKNLRAKMREDKWSCEQKEKDKLLMRRKAYFLPGSAISSSTECHASPCSYRQESSLDKSLSSALLDMTVSSKKYPMMLCFSCNRTFHCVCVGMTVEKLKIEPVPYTCPECTTNENNEHAKSYYASKKWSVGIKSRRKEVLCATAVAEKPYLLDEQATDDELDAADESSMSSSLFHTATAEKSFGEIGTVPMSVYQQQRTEMEEMTQLLVKAEAKNEELSAKVSELEEQVAELDDLKKRLIEIEKKTEAKNEQHQVKPRVTIAEKSQIIPSSVLSSTMYPEVLTVKDMLARNYLNKTARAALSTLNPAISGASNGEISNTTVGNYETHIENNDGETSKNGTRNLSASESILLEQAEITREASRAQREMTSTMSLELRRKSLPKIGKFCGDPKDWIRFKRDVKRYHEIGKFDEDLMKMYILQSLEGIALERVQDLIDTSPLSHTMKMLEEGFGESSRIIEKCAQDILNLRLEKDLYRDDVMIINTKIQAYFSACIYAKIDFANTNQLAKHIFDQFSPYNKQFFRNHFRSTHPNDTTKLIDLESIFAFLEDLAKDLEDKKVVKKEEKPKPKLASIMVTSLVNNQSKSRGSDDYMYEIRDKTTAPFIGYDMSVVSAFPKVCESCGSNQHYTVECINYKEMDHNGKVRFVSEKNMCRNCVITNSHQAVDCNVKALCGYRNGNFRCPQKHHITLHKALAYNTGRVNNWNGNKNFGRSQRRNGTQWNTERANNILNDGNSSHNSNVQVENQQQQQPQPQQMQSNAAISQANTNNISYMAPSISELPHASQNRNFGNGVQATAQMQSVNADTQRYRPIINVVPYASKGQVMNISCFNLGRTVKVFKNQFLGKNGFVVGYSVGDSAAEVSLVREDLRKALGIEGEKCKLELQWTDKTRKTVEATKIDLCLQGLHENSEKLVLKNCYAIENLDLPPRSLDMDVLRQKFPYLSDVKFESYEEVSPWLIIGSPHAAVIESIGTLRQDGEGKPVGLLAKLGWCVYGGCSEEINKPQEVMLEAGQNETLSKGNLSSKFNNPPISFDLKGNLEVSRQAPSSTEGKEAETRINCSPWNNSESGTSKQLMKKKNSRRKYAVVSSLLLNRRRPYTCEKSKTRTPSGRQKSRSQLSGNVKKAESENAMLPNLHANQKSGSNGSGSAKVAQTNQIVVTEKEVSGFKENGKI